jgi:outer membrane protein assembly factor BamB
LITRKLRFWIVGAALLVLAVAMAGCTGSSVALTGASWPGITVSSDTIYMAYGPAVYAINPETHLAIWQFPTTAVRGETFYAAPAVASDLVVVTDYTDSVYALDPTNGRQIWRFQPEAKGDRSRFIGGAVIGDQYVYAGTVDGTLYAFDRTNGGVVWAYKYSRDIWASPLLDNGVLYITSLDKHIYAVDAASGDKIWQFPAEGETLDPPMGGIVGTPTLYDGVLYFGSFNDHVYAVAADTHKELWTYEASNWVWSSPVLDDVSGYLIGGDLDGHVFALDPIDGTEKWSFDMDAPLPTGLKHTAVGAPALADTADGKRVAYFTSGDSYIYMLNTSDGTKAIVPVSVTTDIATRFLIVPTGTSTQTVPLYAPPIVYNDLLIVGATKGDNPLLVFNRSTLLESWAFKPAS